MTISWGFWSFSPFGAPMAPFLGWTNGSLVEVNQWLLCWGEPMVPLLGEPMAPWLGWTNGSLVGVNQWFPCWGEPMAPFLGWTNGSLLGWTNGSLVGVNQWLPSWGGPKPFSSGWRLAAGAFWAAKKRICSGRSRWNKLKMTDLEKSMRTDLGKKGSDCRSSEWRTDLAQKV